MRSKITFNAAESPAVAEMYAGNFYRRRRDGQLVFCASTTCGPGALIKMKEGVPDLETPVVAIGRTNGGYSLRGLFGPISDYELVDVDITVKPHAGD